MKDTLVIGGHEFQSRFILGSGKYSLDLINAAVQNAGAQIITLALRRANEGGTANILDYIPEGVTLLPNTSGARNADEAVRIARLSRACGCGDFVKIEIMRDSKYLLPDNQETIRATEILANEGFVVMPYMYPDLNVARDLVNAGAASIMPLAAPNPSIIQAGSILITLDRPSTPNATDTNRIMVWGRRSTISPKKIIIRRKRPSLPLSASFSHMGAKEARTVFQSSFTVAIMVPMGMARASPVSTSQPVRIVMATARILPEQASEGMAPPMAEIPINMASRDAPIMIPV